MDRGLAAATAKDWNEAVRWFTLAERKAHLAPQVLFNLGLAHAKAGNELLADVYLRAYLAELPDAANASAVRAEVERLEAVSREKVKKLYAQAIAQAEVLPLQGEPGGLSRNGRRHEALKAVARSQVYTGDGDGGMDTYRKAKAVQVDGPSDWFEEVQKERREKAPSPDFLAENGALDEAFAASAAVTGYDLASLGEKFYKAGQPERAEELLARGTSVSGYYWYSLAGVYAEQGKFGRAEALSYRVSGEDREVLYEVLSRRKLEQGDAVGGLRYARQAPGRLFSRAISGQLGQVLEEFRVMKPSVFAPCAIEETLSDIAGALVVLDDLGGARQAADMARYKECGGLHFYPLAEGFVLLASGDAEGALARTRTALSFWGPGGGTWISPPDRVINSREYDLKFTRSLFNAALARNDLNAAEKIADLASNQRERLNLLRRVEQKSAGKGDTARTARLTGKIAAVVEESRMGALTDEAAEKAVEPWLEASDAMLRGALGKGALFDFPAFTEWLKTQPGDEVGDYVIRVAEAHAGALVRIRATARSRTP